MSPIVQLALEEITERINVMTGLTNSSDRNAAKEMLVRLHQAGEDMCPSDIVVWCMAHDWQHVDAKELAGIATLVERGGKPKITGARIGARTSSNSCRRVSRLHQNRSSKSVPIQKIPISRACAIGGSLIGSSQFCWPREAQPKELHSGSLHATPAVV